MTTPTPEDPRDAVPEAEGEQLVLDESFAGPGLGKAKPLGDDERALVGPLESLVLAAERPLSTAQLAKLVGAKAGAAKRALEHAAEHYAGRGIELVEVAGGWQFRTSAAHAHLVRELVAAKPIRLTRAQLETLAIVAYRQPITRPEVDEVRGVDSGSALKVLLERGLAKILGRKDEPGRPILYGTAPAFLELFGLASLKDLPTLKEFSELSEESRSLFERRIGEPLPDGVVLAEDDEAPDPGDLAAEEGAVDEAAEPVEDAAPPDEEPPPP